MIAGLEIEVVVIWRSSTNIDAVNLYDITTIQFNLVRLSNLAGFGNEVGMFCHNRIDVADVGVNEINGITKVINNLFYFVYIIAGSNIVGTFVHLSTGYTLNFSGSGECAVTDNA